jgi:N utilization substance protein B
MSDLKSIQRLLVVQALYETTINKYEDDYSIDQIFKNIIVNSDFKKKLKNSNLTFALEIYRGVSLNLKNIDKVLSESIDKKIKKRSLDNLFISIFRTAIFELKFHRDISKSIVISEYLMITKRFFGDKECSLLNGVLDNLR